MPSAAKLTPLHSEWRSDPQKRGFRLEEQRLLRAVVDAQVDMDHAVIAGFADQLGADLEDAGIVEEFEGPGRVRPPLDRPCDRAPVIREQADVDVPSRDELLRQERPAVLRGVPVEQGQEAGAGLDALDADAALAADGLDHQRELEGLAIGVLHGPDQPRPGGGEAEGRSAACGTPTCR